LWELSKFEKFSVPESNSPEVNQNRFNWDIALQDFYWPATAEYGQLMNFV